jgi:nuclear cap-binding protein subunit 1
MIKAMEKNQIEFKNIIQNIESLMNKRKRYHSMDELDLLW